MHQQLTEADRAVLAQLLELKYSKQKIASRLGVHRSTIFRELRRNTGSRGYDPQEAQQRTDTRRWVNRTPKMRNAQTLKYVQERLRQQWSPDQIAGRSEMDFPRDPKRRISRQTIYTWIDRQKRERHPEWRGCLRFGKPRRRRPEGRLRGAVSIDGRPHVVDTRQRYGDWEGDTIVGRDRRGGLVSLVERKSGYTLLKRVDNLKSRTVCDALTLKLKRLDPLLRRTATFDNGSEFAQHERLAQAAGVNIYFARPYAAWQRGTNENTNGLVRQSYPKGTDLAAESHRAVAAVEKLLNDRPRKRLAYRTPREVITQHLAHYGVAFGS
ncbi:MAG: IS30 family transposase [Planctomycetia bacterium]|nr:IS30 family transposase [Planctomycetia bacterium]